MLIQLGLLLLGGILSVFGGYFGVIIRIQLENRQEIDFIKICLIDELEDIENAYKEILKKFTQSSIVTKEDLNGLLRYTDSYERTQNRIYLIRDKKLRKNINDFYRKIPNTIKNAEQQIIQLGVQANNPNPTHNKVLQEIETISNSAQKIKDDIRKYEHKKNLWLF